MAFELKDGLSDQEWAEVSQWLPRVRPLPASHVKQETTWVVDPSNHTFFVRVLAHQGREPDLWLLFTGGHVAEVNLWRDGEGVLSVRVDVTWRLAWIELPPGLERQRVLDLVKAALTLYGAGPRARTGTVAFGSGWETP